MKPTDLRRRARQVYAQTRNLTHTCRLLKQEGFHFHENTIRRWAKGDGWDQMAAEYDSRAREVDGLAAGIEDEIMRRNVRLIGDLEKTLLPGGDETGLKGRTRDLIDLQRQVIDLVKLREDKEKRAAVDAGRVTPQQAARIARRTIELMREHPKVAVVFEEHREELLTMIEQRIEEIDGRE